MDYSVTSVTPSNLELFCFFSVNCVIYINIYLSDSTQLTNCTLYIKGHPYHTEGITCMAITSDSSLTLTGSNDGSVHIVNITTGKVCLH